MSEDNLVTWDELRVDYNKTKKQRVPWGDKEVEIEFRNIPWERYNQITLEVVKENKGSPVLQNKALQDKLLKELIVSVAGRKCDAQFWHEVDWKFIEALRIAIFGSDIGMLYDEELLKNLVRELVERTKDTD